MKNAQTGPRPTQQPAGMPAVVRLSLGMDVRADQLFNTDWMTTVVNAELGIDGAVPGWKTIPGEK